MPNGVSDNSNSLQAEGQSIVLDFLRTSPTTGTLTWKIPSNYKVYNGILITAALKEHNPSNYPTDGVVYTASPNLASQADTIGGAKVVVALYNDVTTVTTLLTNLDPSTVYFFSAHLISNVNTYYAAGTKSYPQGDGTEIYAGDVQKLFGPPDNPTQGTVYFDETQKLTFFWDGAAWQPTTSHTTITGKFDPVSPFTGLPDGYPKPGDFFYNTTIKLLKIWSGFGWLAAESTTGVPMYQKQDVGTDLTYSARAKLIDVLKRQLGYPKICVELDESHFNIAIDNALMEIRRRVDSAYTKQYFFMTIQAHQGLYYLNDTTVGTDKIVDVIRIHRVNNLGLGNFSPDNIYAQQFLTQFYAPGVGYDLVSIHLIHAMSETFSQLFAGEITFNWREPSRELSIYRRLQRAEKVLIETSCEKLEQEILTDRWLQQWVQQWAESELMLMLSHIRGKFSTLPGPGGSLTLNADTLLAEGQRLQEDCLRQVRDMEVGQNGPDNWYSPMVIG